MPLFPPLHLKKGTGAERQQQIAKEIEKRQGKSATYTVPLVNDQITPEQQQDVESFLSEFYCHGIFGKSREMRMLLKQNPATIGTHYALLVPDVVSFDQFWSRYFFRCSQTTILQEIRIASEHEDEMDDIKEAETTAGQKEGAPNSPAAVVERTASGSGSNFLKRQIERGLGVIRSHSNSSTDSDNKIYQAAIAEAEDEEEDKAAAASAVAAQRAEIFRSEEDTDFIETIEESDEKCDESCVSEEDLMIGSTAAAAASPPPPPVLPPPPPPALAPEEQEAEAAAEENETAQPAVAAGGKEAYFESSEAAEELLDSLLEEQSAPMSSREMSPPEEQLVTETL